MKRGFKTACENTAKKIRSDLNLEPHAPVDPRRLAQQQNIQILDPLNVADLPQATIDHLLGMGAQYWSAAALKINSGYVILYNSAHSLARQTNDIMHEMAHVLLGHEPFQSCFSADVGLFMRYFDDDQEQEADCWASTVLLPRDALFWAKKNNLGIDEIANAFQVSTSLVNMRMNLSGVNRIYQRSEYLKNLSFN